jgi:hypothetical protein
MQEKINVREPKEGLTKLGMGKERRKRQSGNICERNAKRRCTRKEEVGGGRRGGELGFK